MTKKRTNISLDSYEDIFSTEETRKDTGEHVLMMPVDKIQEFKNHPFNVNSSKKLH